MKKTPEEVVRELEAFRSDLIAQAGADDNENYEKHIKRLLELSTKYPQQREIIEFVVLQYDDAKRSVKQMRNEFISTIDTIISYKIYTVEQIDNCQKKKFNLKKVVDKGKQFILYKYGFIVVVVTVLLGFYLFSPSGVKNFFNDIWPFVEKIIKGA